MKDIDGKRARDWRRKQLEKDEDVRRNSRFVAKFFKVTRPQLSPRKGRSWR